jgi:hypothetical protein
MLIFIALGSHCRFILSLLMTETSDYMSQACVNFEQAYNSSFIIMW